jgi:predicted dehydrogenase
LRSVQNIGPAWREQTPSIDRCCRQPEPSSCRIPAKLMKQVVQDLQSGRPKVLDVPAPRPGPGQILVRTQASLVSAGTERTLVEFASKGLLAKARARPDLVRQILDKVRQEGLLSAFDAVRRRLDQPVALGYSSSGIVEAVGDGVTGYRAGDRVACAGGGHASHSEFAVVPEHLVAQLPASVDFDSGAFGTLGAIALHGYRLAGVQVGEKVAVIGLGLLGQIAIGIVRAAGCAAFGIDVDEDRVKLADSLGGTSVLRSEAVEAGEAFTQGGGFDAVLICAHTADNDPLELAGLLARDRARIVLIGVVGMEIPRRLYYDKELNLTVSRSYGPGRYDPTYEERGIDYPIGYVRWTEQRNIASFLELLELGKLAIAPLITHRLPIQEAEQAYELIVGDQMPRALGVLLTYGKTTAPDQRIALSERPVRPEAVVRIGALGAGNFARGIAFPILRRMKEVELIGLATASGLSGGEAGRRYGFNYTSTTSDELLADEHINTIAVLTRHHLHASMTAAALRAGKHVFCEKPLAIDGEGLDEVREALQDADGSLTVGYNRRFAPMAVAMREFMSQAGEPLSVHYRVNAGSLPIDHWAHDPSQGGGRIVGEICHFVDFLIFLIGERPVRLTTVGLPDGKRYLEDNVQLGLEFPDGSLGTVAYLASGDRAYPKERVEVFGGGRVAVLDDFRKLETVVGGKRRVRRSWLRQNKGHRAIWEAFVEPIRVGGAPPIAYADLLASAEVTLAAVTSLRSNEPVDLRLEY